LSDVRCSHKESGRKGKEMYIPKLSSIGKAIQIYYENIELSNTDIKELFKSRQGKNLSSATISKLKAEVQKVAQERKMPIWDKGCVNTKLAFEVWGLDIGDLEKRWAKLQKFREKEAV
jgi:hypothetical protein